MMTVMTIITMRLQQWLGRGVRVEVALDGLLTD